MSNAAAKYRDLVERCFGDGSANFRSSEPNNNVTGALTHSQFHIFNQGLEDRLHRLATQYPVDGPGRQSILNTVNNVASSKTWEGAYSELVAIDFLNSDKDWLGESIELDRDVPGTETLASAKGMSGANFDGYYPEFGVSFDVKAFKDKIGDILSNVIKIAKNSAGDPTISIKPQYPLDADYTLFEGSVRALSEELSAGIKADSKAHGIVVSSVVKGLSYQFARVARNLFSSSTFDTYHAAANQHQLLFRHAKKFSRTSPSIIVFVVFPWFSDVTHQVFGEQSIFYRAMCRRFFCGYLRDSRPASDLLDDFDSSVTVCELTRHLSGVIFLEDNSVLVEGNAKETTSGFAYLNPNAYHKPGNLYIQHLRSLDLLIDDLEGDNY